MKLLLILSLLSSSVFAAKPDLNTFSESLDYAQVTKVLATQKADGSWCFGTSVKHNDQGWDHYADAWEVIDLDGNKLGYRQLHHPHDHEQPFTRSQCNIDIPTDISQVLVRAKCNQHGYGGKAMVVDLSKSQRSH